MRKGESQEVQVDLSEHYALKPESIYDVQFSFGLSHKSINSVVIETPTMSDDSSNRARGLKRGSLREMKSKKSSSTCQDTEPTEEEIIAERCQELEDSGFIKRTERETFYKCPDSKVDQMLNEGLAYLEAELPNYDYHPIYTRTFNSLNFNYRFWFGPLTSPDPVEQAELDEKLAAACAVILQIKKSFYTPHSFAYDCDPTSCFEGVEAYVFANQTSCACVDREPCGTVHLCDAFFEDQDRPQLVILHEWTHFQWVGATTDLCLGLFECSELARLQPERTPTSADTFGIAFDFFRILSNPVLPENGV